MTATARTSTLGGRLLFLAIPAFVVCLGLRNGWDLGLSSMVAPAAPTGPLVEVTETLRPSRSSPTPQVTPSTIPGIPVSRPQLPTPQLPTPQLPTPQLPPTIGAPPATLMMGFWNLENFFDDHDDGRNGQGDKEYDTMFAKHPELFRLKLDKLCEGILSLAPGRGPDIMAMAEVEDIRAAQELQAALNARIPDPNLHYKNLLMKEMNSGRHIAPAILTRLPVAADRTKAVGSRLRILEGHVVANNHDLTVIVGHWTSRLPSKTGNGSDRRMEYAEKMYGEANAIYHANPKADILLCGDFNDNPTDPSVTQGLGSSRRSEPAPVAGRASPSLRPVRQLAAQCRLRDALLPGLEPVRPVPRQSRHARPRRLGVRSDDGPHRQPPGPAERSAASAMALRQREGEGAARVQRSLPGDGGAVGGAVIISAR